MSETETRILQMKRYIDGSNMKHDMYCFSSKDFCAIHDLMKADKYEAIKLAFLYGEAKGYRKAKLVTADA